ncbi:MAG: amidohydrolase family protein [Clostridia bacterium]|nr:amidohydrolase family protein [Clostridia bacterium]
MYIVGGGKLITLSESVPYFENGAVVCDGELVIDIGTTESMLDAYKTAEFIDVKGAYILPGFVDMHAHSRNIALSAGILPRFHADERYRTLKNCLWALEGGVDHSDASALLYAFAARAIKNGVTSVFEMHSLPCDPSGSLYSAASIIRECGLRACIGYDISERFGARKAALSIRENSEFIEFCSGLSIDTLKPAFGINSLLELGDEMLDACIKANHTRTRLIAHIGETPEEHLFSLRKHGKTPVQRLFDKGAVNPDSVFLCGPFTLKEELELIIENDCFAVISPIMASLLNSSYSAEFEKYASCGVIFLSSDGLTDSLLENARAAAFQFSVGAESSSNILISAVKMLFQANPAAASRVFGHKLGVIEPGAAADVIALRPSLTQPFVSKEQLLGSLIWTGAACEFTMVNGRILMRDGKLSELDEKRISADFSAALMKLQAVMRYDDR